MTLQVIEKIDGNNLTIQGVSGPVFNFSSFDFLSFGQDASIKKAAKDALDFYGCGSCGPRGFYGTIDKHLNLEDAIAKFMGTQVCISIGLFSHCLMHSGNPLGGYLLL